MRSLHDAGDRTALLERIAQLSAAPELRITNAAEFAAERVRVQDLVTQFAGVGDPAAAVAHSLFGVLTRDEWARLQHRHLDHHLRQFGV